MKKMSRKIAAIIAAAMTATTMGVMNAFAGAITVPTTAAEHYSNDTTSKEANVSLNIEPYAGLTAPTDPDNTEVGKHVWSVTVDQDALVWKVKRNVSGGNYNLQWDTTYHKYKVTDAVNESVSFEMYNNDSADKTVTLTNNSNFAVEYDSGITCDLENLFSVSAGGSGTIPVYDKNADQVNNVATSTVSFDINTLNNNVGFWTTKGIGDGTDPRTAVQVGTLTYTFTVGGDPVGDVGQYNALGDNNDNNNASNNP